MTYTITTKHRKERSKRLLAEKNPRWNGGCSKYPEYMNYRNMIRRGRSTKGSYKNINVCKRWQESFWNFYKDMGEKPVTGRYTVDRIDTTQGYSPDNCRWATAHEQRLNTNKRTFSEKARENIRQGRLRYIERQKLTIMRGIE